MKKQKKNVLGIIGTSSGWAIPIVGIVLGIIALSRKEPNKVLGVISIVEGFVFWIVWYMMW